MKALYGALAVMAITLSSFSYLQAQQSVSIGTATIDADAVLFLLGDGTQGLIIPKTSDLPNMPKKAGMVVYNEGDGKVYSCDGTSWTALGGGVQGNTPSLLINGNQMSIFTGLNVNLAATTPTNVGQLFMWDGTKWTSTSVPANPISAGQVLTWTGTSWQPQTLPAGGTVSNVSGTAPITITNNTTTPVVSLANSGVTAATYGNTNVIPQLAIDAFGRVTSAANIAIQNANATTTGVLSNTDWTTFNSKGNGTVTNVTGTAPITVTTGTTTPVITLANTAVTAGSYGSNVSVPVLTIDAQGRVTSATNANIPTANTSTSGLLSNTDWNTFNNKGTGTVTNVSAGTGITVANNTTTPIVTLANTAVTAGSYGSATQVPQITVDAQGRITGVTLATVSAGTFGNLTTSTTGVNIVGGSGAVAGAGATVNIQNANATQPGLLTAADFTTFTNKLGTGTTAGGDLTGTYPNPTLATSGVTAASYGTSTSVPQLTVDAKGRITAASSVAIPTASGTTTGLLASADFTTFTNKLGTGTTAGGDLTGTYPNPTLATSGVTAASYGTSTSVPQLTVDAKGRITAASSVAIPTASGTTTGLLASADFTTFTNKLGTGTAAGGDLTGTYPNPTLTTSGVTAASYGTSTSVPQLTVDAKGRITAASSITIPTASGTTTGLLASADFTTFTNKLGTGTTAGGDLTGTYPNPTIQNQGTTGTNIITAINNGTASGTIPITRGGTGATTAAGALAALGGFANPMTTAGDLVYGGAGGTPTRLATGTGFLRGGASPVYSSVNLASTDVIGTLPVANGGTGAATLTGVLVGNGTGAFTGVIHSGANQYLRRNSANSGYEFGDLTLVSGDIVDGTIVNIDINSAAAIDGTKVNPAFGTQNISTTGTLSSGAITATNLASVNTVPYTWPNVQGAANTVLTNNGSGTLSWAVPSGLSNALPIGQMFVGNASNIATAAPLTGDATLNFNVGNAILTIGSGVINSTKIADGTIADIDISGTAAIAGTKVIPSFGTQNILTTGTFSAGASTLSSLIVPGITTLNTVPYTWPAAQGVATSVLTNNGSGVLNWAGLGTLATLSAVSGGVGGTITDATITDADISATATIAGTKIVSAFGNQSITTTGVGAAFIVGGINAGSANEFSVSSTGNITRINNLQANFPSSQGAAGSVLTNDGVGNLSWASGSGWGLAGNANINPATNFIGTTDAQPLRFNTGVGGVERMRIDANGHVGIGLNTPLYKLQVLGATGTTNTSSSFSDGVNSTFRIAHPSALVAAVGANTLQTIQLGGFDNGDAFFTPYMTLLPSGNVGIGTNAPANQLQIGDYSSAQDNYLSIKTAGGNSYKSGIKLRNFADDDGFTLVSDETVNQFKIIRHPSGTAETALMINRLDGYVGIGTTTPTARLEVAGLVKITGGTPGVNKVLTSDATGLATWQPASSLGAGNGLTVNGANLDLGSVSMTNPTVTFKGPSSNMFELISSNATSGTKAGFNLRMEDSYTGRQYEVISRKSDGTPNSGASDFLINNLFSTGGGYIEAFKIDGASSNILINADNTTGSPFGNFLIPNGNVGVGTTSPTSKFHLTHTSASFTYVDGSQAAGKVLTSDANGLASWQSAGGSGWALGGNSGLTDGAIGVGNNYIGTTTTVPLNFIVNNQKAGRIDPTGPVFLGSKAGELNADITNTGIGFNALALNTVGYENTAIGFRALRLSTGINNTAVGSNSMISNTTGGENTAIGTLTLEQNTTGIGNTALGRGALFTNVGGFGNTALGFGADVLAPGLVNATAIGQNSKVGASNSMVLGGTSADAVNVGIGTTSPSRILHIQGGSPYIRLQNGTTNNSLVGQDADRFSIWTNATNADASWAERFSINNSTGNVGIGTTTPLYNLHVSSATGPAMGVFNNSDLYAPIFADNANANGFGIVGYALGANGRAGVFNGGYIGVSGTAATFGVSGDATGAGGAGVVGTASGAGGRGIYGSAIGSATEAGFFIGDVNVLGNFTASGSKSFRIDHPLDPENKYLYHNAVESPDMMNVYNGNIKTDSEGLATVELPNYFSALNKDFRYQLTVIGEFAQAIVSEEVEGNSFKIKTDKPNVKVSWQVTGVRKDPVAEKFRMVPEVDKQGEERGKYLIPAAYGKSDDFQIGKIKEDKKNTFKKKP